VSRFSERMNSFLTGALDEVAIFGELHAAAIDRRWPPILAPIIGDRR
jgi:hypothetical protein